ALPLERVELELDRLRTAAKVEGKDDVGVQRPAARADLLADQECARAARVEMRMASRFRRVPHRRALPGHALHELDRERLRVVPIDVRWIQREALEAGAREDRGEAQALRGQLADVFSETRPRAAA